jgi:hypothetical protein
VCKYPIPTSKVAKSLFSNSKKEVSVSLEKIKELYHRHK